MLAGAAGTVAAGLIATTLQIVLGLVPGKALGDTGMAALYAAWLASGVPVLFMPLAVMQFGGVEAMRRYTPIPGWLTAVGYAGVTASVLGTVTTFYASGPFALSGPVGYVAFLLFALWVVVISFRLIASPYRSMDGDAG